MKKNIPQPLIKGQKAAIEVVKDKTSTPQAQRRKVLRFNLGVGILILAFAILAFLVFTIPSFTFDLSISQGLQSLANPFFGGLMTFISWVGFSPQAFIVTLIIIVIIFLFGYHWEATASLFTASIVSLLNFLIKILIHRPRPAVGVLSIDKILNSYSFPSGHVMYYTAFFGFICFLIFSLLKPSWIRTVLLIVFGIHVVLVGFSRIYSGEHWASDVLGGYLLGTVCLLGFIRFYRWGKLHFFVKQTEAMNKKT